MFWGHIIAEEPVWNWHIKELCDILQKAGISVAKRQPKDKDIVINIPPGTSKSTICTIMFPAWLWIIDPTLAILTGSYAASLSLEHATKSRMIITSDLYTRLFPYVVLKDDQAAKSNYQTTKNGARITTSTDGTATGRHAHIIILDDPQNSQMANSEKERQRTNAFVSGTLATRKVDKNITLTIFVQQRLHPQDVTGFLFGRGKEYTHICLPAELSKVLKPDTWAVNYRDGLLDPIRLSHKILEEMKVDLGSRNYNTQMGQDAEGDKDSIIKEAWMPIVSALKFEELRKEYTRNMPFVDFFIDTAYTDNTANDPSALIAVQKFGDIVYVLEAVEVWLEFPEFIKFLQAFCQRNGYTNSSRVRIEPKASGKSVVQVLKTTHLNVSEAPAPTKSKLERLNAIAPKVEAGKIRIVDGLWNSPFIQQCTTNFPRHDDMRDTFIMAIDDKLIHGASSGKYNMGFV
jgi:predicted phage terminase large subunit-like protein